MLLNILACQNINSSFIIEGTWVDMSCDEPNKNCISRYPTIQIVHYPIDTIQIITNDGQKKHIWTNNQYDAITITLENDFETLLYPIYDKNIMAYYDDVNKKFVYYKKVNKIAN